MVVVSHHQHSSQDMSQSKKFKLCLLYFFMLNLSNAVILNNNDSSVDAATLGESVAATSMTSSRPGYSDMEGEGGGGTTSSSTTNEATKIVRLEDKVGNLENDMTILKLGLSNTNQDVRTLKKDNKSLTKRVVAIERSRWTDDQVSCKSCMYWLIFVV